MESDIPESEFLEALNREMTHELGTRQTAERILRYATSLGAVALVAGICVEAMTPGGYNPVGFDIAAAGTAPLIAQIGRKVSFRVGLHS